MATIAAHKAETAGEGAGGERFIPRVGVARPRRGVQRLRIVEMRRHRWRKRLSRGRRRRFRHGVRRRKGGVGIWEQKAKGREKRKPQLLVFLKEHGGFVGSWKAIIVVGAIEMNKTTAAAFGAIFDLFRHHEIHEASLASGHHQHILHVFRRVLLSTTTVRR